jgi:serine/threonine kinase 38
LLRRAPRDPSLPPPSLVTISVDSRPDYRRKRELAYSTVGTPDYIAPEVFSQNGYNETIDWWSVGVILFEMLIGYPPFYSEDPTVTCQKILHWRKTLRIPTDAHISSEAADLILKLVRDPYDRLGSNGIEEIKSHPFFNDLDWKNLRDSPAPYIPEVKDEADTSNFDKFSEEEPLYQSDLTSSVSKRRKDIEFIGYTFKKDNSRDNIITALQDLETFRKSYTRPVSAN